MTAGSRLATAVPDDVMMGVGRAVALEWPRPQNASDRSSMAMWTRRRGWRTAASARGEERDPVGMLREYTNYNCSFG